MSTPWIETVRRENDRNVSDHCDSYLLLSLIVNSQGKYKKKQLVSFGSLQHGSYVSLRSLPPLAARGSAKLRRPEVVRVASERTGLRFSPDDFNRANRKPLIQRALAQAKIFAALS
jgi:hypothetical protein